MLKFWSGLRCGLGRSWLNREETFADVFFQDTEQFPSFGVSSLQVGDSVRSELKPSAVRGRLEPAGKREFLPLNRNWLFSLET